MADTSSKALSATAFPKSFEFPSSLPTPPFINISGIPNFRDIGGYLTATSHLSMARPGSTQPTMVRKNLVYRCANPQLLTPEGNRQLVNDYGIKHIFDLQSSHEIKKISASLDHARSTDAVNNPRSKALEPDGIERHFTPVYEHKEVSPTAVATKLGWYTARQKRSSNLPYPYSEGFVSAYRDISTHATISENSRPSHNAAAYPTILRQILEHPDEPIIFHCSAGKDRTGVLAAILLKLAGVDDETIAWEYALTEPGLGSWRRLFIERVAQAGMIAVGADGKNGTQEHKPTSEMSKGSDEQQDGGTSGPEAKAANPAMTRAEAARLVGARSGNMCAFLRLVLDDEFGGVEKYLTMRCGLTQEEVERLREILVIPVSNVEDVVPITRIKIDGWTAEGGMQDE